MSIFTIKQGDTSPALEVVLRDGDGIPVDLTGASVTLRMNRRNADHSITGAPSIPDPGGGRVVYEWQPGDTDTPGLYAAEFYIEFPDGSDETFPNNTYLTVYIPRKLS